MQRLEELILGKLSVPAGHAGNTHRVHRNEDAINADEGNPEMELAETLVHETAKHLGEPEVDGRKHPKDRSYSHHQMKMSGHEVSIVHREIERRLAQHQARNSAGYKE